MLFVLEFGEKIPLLKTRFKRKEKKWYNISNGPSRLTRLSKFLPTGFREDGEIITEENTLTKRTVQMLSKLFGKAIYFLCVDGCPSHFTIIGTILLWKNLKR